MNAGDTVKIHVSTGTEKATVPSVTGKTQEEAKKALQDLGFVVTVSTSEDSSKDNGIVLKQSLDEGKVVDKGSAITITVNTFEASKTVPVTINVQAITGGYTEDKNTTEETNVVKTVSITITSGGKTLWSDSGVKKNEEKREASITGKGSMDLTLTITDKNGISNVRTKTVNFGTDTAVSFN